MKTIKFKLERRKLLLEIPSETTRDALDAAALEQKFLQSEFSHCFVEPDVWTYVLHRFSVEQAKEGTLDVELQVGEVRPAQLNLTVSSDKMEAEALAEAPYGGSPLATEQVLNHLRNANITNGILKQAIQAIVTHSKQAAPGESFKVIIAKGKKPRNGDDTWFQPLVEDARSRMLQPQEKDKHRVDMRNLGSLITVKVGTPMLQRIPFTEGAPGYTVTGEVIAAKDGKDKNLKPGKGTEISPDDPNCLISSVSGLPIFVDNSAYVDDVLSISNVDVNTGHINYDGSVLIDGDVAPGMRVHATGDITVSGYVDSASLHAEGNITVGKGVIGRQLESHEVDYLPSSELSARLTSDATIWVAYGQYAALNAKLGVHIERQLTHCTLITPGETHIGGEGEAAMGKIIGGHTEIADNFYVGQLGAPAGTRTRIYFSQPAKSEEQLRAEEALASVLRSHISQQHKLLQAKKKIQESGEDYDAHLKENLESLLVQAAADVRNTHSKFVDLQENELYPLPPIRIKINKVVHSGAEFMFHDKIFRVEQTRGPCTIVLKEGQITLES